MLFGQPQRRLSPDFHGGSEGFFKGNGMREGLQKVAGRCWIMGIRIAESQFKLFEPLERRLAAAMQDNEMPCEDACFAVETKKRLVFGVCDGFGKAGSEAGESAAEKIADGILGGKRLDEALKEANWQVLKLEGSGCTATIAQVRKNGEVAIRHIGDSRAYLVRGGIASVITKDDVGARPVLQAGGGAQKRIDVERTWENARRMQELYEKFAAAGFDLRVFEAGERQFFLMNRGAMADSLGNWSPKFKKIRIKMERGDRLVIVSDGISDVLTLKEIGELVFRAKNARRAAGALLGAAAEREEGAVWKGDAWRFDISKNRYGEEYCGTLDDRSAMVYEYR